MPEGRRQRHLDDLGLLLLAHDPSQSQAFDQVRIDRWVKSALGHHSSIGFIAGNSLLPTSLTALRRPGVGLPVSM
jgi:hypothetical protein